MSSPLGTFALSTSICIRVSSTRPHKWVRVISLNWHLKLYEYKFSWIIVRRIPINAAHHTSNETIWNSTESHIINHPLKFIFSFSQFISSLSLVWLMSSSRSSYSIFLFRRHQKLTNFSYSDLFILLGKGKCNKNNQIPNNDPFFSFLAMRQAILAAVTGDASYVIVAIYSSLVFRINDK